MKQPLTKKEVIKWIESLPSDTKFCPDCLTELKLTEGETGRVLMCPNPLCLNEDEYVTKI